MIEEEDSDSEKEVDTPKNIFATSPNVPRLERVRHKLRNLEKQRDDYLIEKRVIGQVSSRHRDIVSELANIPNKRVPFKWQRGIKIGEKFVMLCETLKNNLHVALLFGVNLYLTLHSQRKKIGTKGVHVSTACVCQGIEMPCGFDKRL